MVYLPAFITSLWLTEDSITVKEERSYSSMLQVLQCNCNTAAEGVFSLIWLEFGVTFNQKFG